MNDDESIGTSQVWDTPISSSFVGPDVWLNDAKWLYCCMSFLSNNNHMLVHGIDINLPEVFKKNWGLPLKWMGLSWKHPLKMDHFRGYGYHFGNLPKWPSRCFPSCLGVGATMKAPSFSAPVTMFINGINTYTPVPNGCFMIVHMGHLEMDRHWPSRKLRTSFMFISIRSGASVTTL